MRYVTALAALVLAGAMLAGCTTGFTPVTFTPTGTDSTTPLGQAQTVSQQTVSQQTLGMRGNGAREVIVVLKPGAHPGNVANRHAVVSRHVYSHALNGFAGPVSAARLQALKSDPDVVLVEDDVLVQAVGKPTPSPTPTTPPPPQVVPSGIARVGGPGAALNVNVPAVVAVIDSGIDLSHPNLNVDTVNSRSFAKGFRRPQDGNGHGTHVAGTIGARNNGFGVVGVAPGVSLWAVKVLSDSGTGWNSDVIAGIDYVTANASRIHVANMSLASNVPSAAMDAAVSRAVAAGVVMVLAAGNEGVDVANVSPARVAEAITVSALHDSDGLPPVFDTATSTWIGQGVATTLTFTSTGTTHVYPDDTFANVRSEDGTRALYSNFGPKVDLIAPGTKIFSTIPGGGYNTSTGTSMAAPHVAGAAALIRARTPSLTPAQVSDMLKTNGTLDYSYKATTDDPDGIQEPLINVSTFKF